MTQYDSSVDAIRGLRDGADRWTLADALLADIGPFDSRDKFNAVRAEAETAGVDPLSVSALRQYRDTAHHWPPADRVPGVSFSAHRAALPADDPKGLLGDLADKYGPNGVTVKRVNESVAILAGQNPTPAGTTGPAPLDIDAVPMTDLALALIGRAKAERAAFVAKDPGGQLARVRDGLADLVADIDAAGAKSARKSAAWSDPDPAPKPKPTTKPTPKPKPTGPKPGDIRGL
jgi:hypothetical protein